MKFPRKSADEQGAADAPTPKKKKGRIKTVPTSPAANLDPEERAIYAEYSNNPELASRYEVFDQHENSPERKKQITRRKWIFGVAGAGAAVLAIRTYNLSRQDTGPEIAMLSNDEAFARTYAAEFSRDWYTWDAENLPNRKERLARYNPAFTDRTGWNGVGVQTVTESWATTSEKTGDNTYKVTCANQVADAIQPLYSEVNLYVKDGAASVLSYPNLVAAPELPVSGMTIENRAPLADKSIEAEVKARLEVFFRAWAAGDTATLASVCTTGYNVDPMLTGHTLKELTNTRFFIPEQDSSEAGTVVWANTNTVWAKGDTTMESNYEVTFTYEAGRWLISNLDTSPLFEKALVISE